MSMVMFASWQGFRCGGLSPFASSTILDEKNGVLFNSGCTFFKFFFDAVIAASGKCNRCANLSHLLHFPDADMTASKKNLKKVPYEMNKTPIFSSNIV